ncbi:MAG: hypothetical protein OIN89_07810 [Candidatus Methanoperedens sp.]|jgi:hypothetical protein|nr:hypothetical protein [Candidatus Methanoperedens sp.]PKL53480.1 MAG: hypothetical protein CVV36_06850 [Candidatus Methanoperedenaceae archaeon HGW-Methanoperedenaceae-1]
MRKPVLALFILLILALLLPLTSGVPERRNFELTRASIIFDKTDATITVNYEFPKLMKLYILLLGSKSIEPKIKEAFLDFDYDIIKMNHEQAILRVKNVSRSSQGYYLHESRKLGTSINTVYIYTPDSRTAKQYSNINSTPNTFYRA